MNLLQLRKGSWRPQGLKEKGSCKKLRAVIMTAAECDISVSKLLGFETCPFFLMVSVSVSEIIGIGKSIGIGFEIFWYRKKYRYRFRKKIGIKKI